MVFGVAAEVSGLPDTEREIQVSKYMMNAWATFARNPKGGLSGELGWPRYHPEGNGSADLNSLIDLLTAQ